MPVSSAMIRTSPDGTTTSFHGPKYLRNELTWDAITANRAIQSEETTANESFERWWLETVRGEASWATAGQFRMIRDDATSEDYVVTDGVSPGLDRRIQGYDGIWSVRLAVVENA